MMIYKIERFKELEVGFPFARFTDDEWDKIDYLEQTGIDLEETSCISIGMYTHAYIDYLTKLFSKYDIPLKVTDVTAQYTHTQSTFDEFTNKYISQLDKIEEFMLANTSVDDVLDKINGFGIESLNKIDKQILESIN